MTTDPTPPSGPTSLTEVVLAIADLGRCRAVDRPEATVSCEPVPVTGRSNDLPDPLIELLTDIGRAGSGSAPELCAGSADQAKIEHGSACSTPATKT